MKSFLSKIRSKKGWLTLAISCFFLIALFSFVLIRHITEKNAFQTFCKTYVEQELCTNALDLHFTLKSPEAFHLNTSQKSLPIYEAGDALKEASHSKELLEKLWSFDLSSLSEEEQTTYLIWEQALKRNIALEQFDYLSEPLSPSSGMHTTLPILLAEYSFFSKADAEDYLTLLSQSEDYLMGLLQYEQEKSAAGLFMDNASAKEVIEACYQLADETAFSDGSHFLLVSFSNRLALLVSNNIITEAEKNAYESENDRIVTTILAPAYTALADGLLVLEGTKNTGLCQYDGGKEYYLALLARNTGSDKTIQQIKELLVADFDKNYKDFITLLTQNRALIEQDTLKDFNSSFSPTDPTEILADLKLHMADSFPALPDTTVLVKDLDASLESYCSPAFYLTPTLDDCTTNSIYINHKSTKEGISLYTTLAHEGYPGHLYQTVYFQNNHPVSSYSDIVRGMLYHGGYTEGWAFYVEMLSYDYVWSKDDDAQNNHAENTSKEAVICDALRLETRMQLSLYCLLDIAINYDGASLQTIANILSHYGLGDASVAQSIYQYLIEEPTTYMKYYLGFLEFLEEKELAKALWGNEYSELRFHQTVLDAGPCEFSYLKKVLQGN